MIQLKFFASLREHIGRSQLEYRAAGVQTVDDLVKKLSVDYPSIRSAFNGPVLVAVNQQMASRSSIVRDGDEVALFPPVTGG